MSESTARLDKSTERALERTVLRKLDWHILPLVTALYFANYLDRSNIGNARIAGLEKDLHLHGTQFNVALLVFFIPYLLSDLPSNMVIKRLKPNRWLSFLTAGWGTVTILTGLARNYASLIAVRLLLGLFEGGVAAGVVLYLSSMYKRHELQTRVGIFYSAGVISGGFGGLFASAILQMDGVGKIAGWRWLFILEGIATFILAIMTYFLLPSDIASAKFLTIEEKDYALWRLKQDGETPKKDASAEFPITSEGSMTVKSEYLVPEQEAFEWREIMRGLFDILTWINGLALFGIAAGTYSFSFFLPSIVAGLGYSGYQAQLHTVPPYALAAFLTVSMSILSDRLKLRGPFSIVFLPLTMMGYIIMITGKTNAIRYIGCCFIAAGVATASASIVTCVLNNTNGHYKRATVIAAQVVFASAGGLAATFLYTPDQKPKYIKGHVISLSLIILAWVMVTAQVFYCLWENKARREGRRNLNIMKYQALRDAGLTKAPIGDRHPDFKLTL